ncbi:cytochrome P450 [Thozetella sp. PMI_491]|nr:cytochrome P450 [Thozetella sp. PMI_491]
MTFSPSVESFTAVLTWPNLARLAGLWLGYQVLVALYNISPFHPLSRFPGPKLAAMTLLYECWYDLILVGKYTKAIAKMHEAYGPIVRISPSELHCNDPDFIDEIYAGAGRKRDKPQHLVNSFAGPSVVSAFATIDHDLHRVRRGAMNKFFSRSLMLNLEGDIRELAAQLCDKLIRNPTRGRPFDLTSAYSCYTSDVISAYCFGTSLGFVAQPDWEPNFREPINGFANGTFIFRFFPVLRGLVTVVPFFSRFLPKEIRILMTEMYVHMPARIRKAKVDREAGIKYDRPTVFSDILGSSLPEEEKTVFRLVAEGFGLVGAGTETTSWAMTVLSYHLLTKPELLDRLRESLERVDPANLESWVTLEKIPYLYAVIMESLRLSYGIGARSPRIPRDEDLVYRGIYDGQQYEYVIPKGTSIGMSTFLIHHNKDLFPDSEIFIPERWLDSRGLKRRELEKGFFAFSRGSRQCVGMNLAQCELYLVTAALALRVFPRMKLYETTVEDVEYNYDMLVARPKASSKGVRVVMPELLEEIM